MKKVGRFRSYVVTAILLSFKVSPVRWMQVRYPLICARWQIKWAGGQAYCQLIWAGPCRCIRAGVI